MEKERSITYGRQQYTVERATNRTNVISIGYLIYTTRRDH
jgi:hypothetical protein